MAPDGTRPAASVLIGRAVSPSETIAIARRAEEIGLRQVWVTEDCFYKGGLTSSAAILASTRRISVGIGVLPAFVRHPAVTAMEIATITAMFPGRFEPGLGTGVPPILEQMGIHPRKIVRQLEQAVTTIRSLLAGEPVTAEDEMAMLRDVRLERPSTTRVPLQIAAAGPQMLRMAGRAADGVILPSLSSTGYARWAVEQLDNVDLPVTMLGYVASGEDPGSMKLAARRFLAERLTGRALSPLMIEHSASRDALEPMLRDGGTDLEQALSDEILSDFLISGTADECLKQVASYRAVGVTQVALCPIPDASGRYDFESVMRIAASIDD